LIKCFCPENGIVLDPFFGSGIVGDVCDELNRNFIAFEIDTTRVEMFNEKRKCNTVA
jgi:site-specific DNA-methyltransferase (adenine-specific)